MLKQLVKRNARRVLWLSCSCSFLKLSCLLFLEVQRPLFALTVLVDASRNVEDLFGVDPISLNLHGLGGVLTAGVSELLSHDKARALRQRRRARRLILPSNIQRIAL